MKQFRRLSALVMALVLVLSLSIGVLAADFDNMTDGFNYDGEDTEVNINLKENDEYGSYDAKEGKTYNISSDNGSTLISNSLGGSGTVNIDGAVVEGSLQVEEQIDVTVNGDVEGSLYAYDQSSLTINGDITTHNDLYAHDQSTVIVNGDSYADMSSYNQSSLTVNGDTHSSVSASDQSSLTINGDANGYDGDPNDVDYSDPFGFSDGSTGIYAYNEATVTVTGNVTGGDSYGTWGYGGTGIYASGEATVTIGGDVTGGNVTADPNTAANINEEGNPISSKGGYGVEVVGNASVTIGGNVTGGSTNGDQGKAGNGLFVFSYGDSGAPTVTVAGTVTGAQAENGTDADGIYIKLEEGAAAPSITVSGYDSASGVLGVSKTYEDDDDGLYVEFVPTRDLTQAELDEIIRISDSQNYGTSFYYSRGRVLNEYGTNVNSLFAFGNDWEETVENGIVTITSAEEKGEVVVTVESLQVMMGLGIEAVVFNGTKLVLKDAVAEHTAYDTYTITASAILLNGAAV